jgi:glutathione S-transferase
MVETETLPTLWHLKVSNFNEKARWALDYKQIPHIRRAAVPGAHRRVAKRLTGGSTFPVLVLDGAAIGDSTQIIEALERRYPDRPLYPPDPALRRRALKLEEFFDEQLGPNVRLLFLHHALPDASLFLSAFVPDLAGPRLVSARATFPLIRRRVISDFGIDENSVERASRALALVGERLATELGPSGYLVGDSFTVADLTAAALVAPVVAPEQFQYPQPQRDHPRIAPLREQLAKSGMLDWVRELYTRHRGSSSEVWERDVGEGDAGRARVGAEG